MNSDELQPDAEIRAEDEENLIQFKKSTKLIKDANL